MSLPDSETPPQPLETSTTPTPSTPEASKKPLNEKMLIALALAENYKDKSWNTAYGEMKAELTKQGKQVSRTTLYRAHQKVTATKRINAIADGKPQKPSLKIENETEKKPEYLEKPIEELPAAEQPAAAAATNSEPMVDVEYFRDMLRGVHDCFLSKDGILGEKYGRPKEQVHATSDNLARYLSKHVSVQQLENYDVPLLIASYASLVLPILNDVRKDRAKKAAEKKAGTGEKKP